MFDYLRGRPDLRRVLLLLDARVEMKDADGAVLELLDQSAVAFQVVLTKADAVKPAAWSASRRRCGAGAAASGGASGRAGYQQRDGAGDRGFAGGGCDGCWVRAAGQAGW